MTVIEHFTHTSEGKNVAEFPFAHGTILVITERNPEWGHSIGSLLKIDKADEEATRRDWEYWLECSGRSSWTESDDEWPLRIHVRREDAGTPGGWYNYANYIYAHHVKVGKHV